MKIVMRIIDEGGGGVVVRLKDLKSYASASS
jgi:hypothetical protein